MIKWFSNILTRASQVRNETVDLANTALRVGSLQEDQARSTPMKWDPDASYEAGQIAYFKTLRSECIMDTTPGESPLTHPLKWSVKVVTDKGQITHGNNLVVTAGAVYDAIQAAILVATDWPIATKEIKGIVRQATDAENNAGIIDDVFVSPKQQHDQLTAVILDAVNPTFQRVLDRDNESTTSTRLIANHDGTDGRYETYIEQPDGTKTKIMSIGVNPDGSIGISDGLDTPRFYIDGGRIFLVGDANITGLAQASNLVLTNQLVATKAQTLYVTIPLHDYGSGFDLQAKLSIEDLTELVGSDVNGDNVAEKLLKIITDAQARTLGLKAKIGLDDVLKINPESQRRDIVAGSDRRQLAILDNLEYLRGTVYNKNATGGGLHEEKAVSVADLMYNNTKDLDMNVIADAIATMLGLPNTGTFKWIFGKLEVCEDAWKTYTRDDFDNTDFQ